MRKTLLLVLLFPAFSFSQMDFGVKGGGLISNIETENDYFNKNRTSFYIGGFAEYKPSKFALNGSLEYMNLGDKGAESLRSYDDLINFKSNLSINKINLSITGRYYIIDNLSVGIGGYVGYNIGSEMESEISRGSEITYEKYSFDYLKDIDFGLTAGIEFTVYKGFFLEARCMFGLNNIFKDVELTDSFDNPAITHKIESKNRVFLFGVGYKF